jgi:hypothetical protein
MQNLYWKRKRRPRKVGITRHGQCALDERKWSRKGEFGGDRFAVSPTAGSETRAERVTSHGGVRDPRRARHVSDTRRARRGSLTPPSE